MRLEIQILAAIVAFAVASMAVFRWAPRASAGRHTSGRGSFALGGWIREWFYWFLGPLEKLFLATRVAPEVFNALGVLLSLAAMIFYARGSFPAAGAFVLLGGLADVFDGVIARGRGRASPFGAFLDSTLDRFAEVAAFLGLAAFYTSRLAAVIVMGALSGSLLVSYTRARGESLGVLCNLGVMQRAERMLLLGFASILDPTLCEQTGLVPGSALLAVVALIAAGSVGTAIFRTFWISNRLRSESKQATAQGETAASHSASEKRASR